eukprot:13557-Heterococcus_DN1.PRE.2
MRSAAVSVLAATALLAVGCDGRGFMPEPLMGRHLLAPPSTNATTTAASNFVPVDDPIHLDPSMYPAELLESATYDVVDGLPKDFIWLQASDCLHVVQSSTSSAAYSMRRDA